ncbi:MAG: winged helix-turn-helix domain-containing protein [Ruminococcus sp.]|nr:winged helix-turn-helix domain-containing protein [Ruminococcus sp.]
MEKDKKEEPVVLQVRMFSGFQMKRGETELDADSLRSRMLTKLLAYLICHRNNITGIHELSEVLWADDASDNPAGALKNLMYRLRSSLKKALGDREYILTGRGNYQWNPEIPVIVDAELFYNYCKKTGNAVSREEKTEAGMKAVGLYKGTFLPEISEEYWVTSLSTYYHSMYLSAVKNLTRLLEEEKQYSLAEQVCQDAVMRDSLDEEIHCHLIRAMTAQNKHKLALAHYQKTVRFLYESLGVHPSRELQELYEELLRVRHKQECDINVIQEEMQEHNQQAGTFFCEYGVFRKIYLLESRSSARLGISVYLVLLTLYPAVSIEKGSEAYTRLFRRGMEVLQEVLKKALRSNDIVCRYSSSQFLIMLRACQYEDAVMITERIKHKFYRGEKKIRMRLKYSIDEIITCE